MESVDIKYDDIALYPEDLSRASINLASWPLSIYLLLLPKISKYL